MLAEKIHFDNGVEVFYPFCYKLKYMILLENALNQDIFFVIIPCINF